MTDTAPARTRHRSLSEYMRDDPDILLTSAQAAPLVPRAHAARAPHPSCFSRWATLGTVKADGTVVHLRTARVGRRLLVSPRMLTEYFAACGATTPTGAAPRQRRQLADTEED